MLYYVMFHHSHENFRSKKGANQGVNECNTYNFRRVKWTQGLTYLCMGSNNAKSGKDNSTLVVLYVYNVSSLAMAVVHTRFVAQKSIPTTASNV